MQPEECCHLEVESAQSVVSKASILQVSSAELVHELEGLCILWEHQLAHAGERQSLNATGFVHHERQRVAPEYHSVVILDELIALPDPSAHVFQGACEMLHDFEGLAILWKKMRRIHVGQLCQRELPPVSICELIPIPAGYDRSRGRALLVSNTCRLGDLAYTGAHGMTDYQPVPSW